MTHRTVKKLTAKERSVFIAAARAFLTSGPDGGRVRYRHRGRDYRGVDCIGIPVCAMAAVGRDVQDPRVYSPMPDGHTLRDALIAHLGQPIPPDELRPGDIALMRWHEQGGTRFFNHVGVVTRHPLGGLALLHSYKPNREVVEHIIGEPWIRRIVEGYRP